ncbi:hypothetical protein [Thermophilibacter sp.]
MADDKIKARGRTVDVDGISVTVTIDPRDDYELAMCSMVIYDRDASQADRSRAVARRNMLVLGDSYQDALDALREAHGGELPVRTVNEFVSKVIREVAEAKN